MAADIVPFGNGDNRVKPRLKVVGVGGAGCNAVSGCGFESVGMYRSRDDVRNLSTHRRLMLTEEHFRFVKSTSPRLLSTLDHECPKNMKEIIGETDLIFVFTGLGGETGSFVTPGVAQICKRLSHLVIVSVVLPFSMEGIERRTLSSTALSNVADASHVTISYPNDGLLEVAPNLPLHKALKIMDEIMMIPLLELSQVLSVDDLVGLRVDLVSAKHLRFGMGIGHQRGDVVSAVEDAFTSPWFDFDLSKVGLAIMVLSMMDPDMASMSTAIKEVRGKVPNAKIRYALRTDPGLGNKVRLMLLLSHQ